MACEKEKDMNEIGWWKRYKGRVALAYSKAKVPSDEKYGELELEGVVQIIVIDNDSGGEHDPDWNDEWGGQFGL
jgi:hypothetical protein